MDHLSKLNDNKIDIPENPLVSEVEKIIEGER